MQKEREKKKGEGETLSVCVTVRACVCPERWSTIKISRSGVFCRLSEPLRGRHSRSATGMCFPGEGLRTDTLLLTNLFTFTSVSHTLPYFHTRHAFQTWQQLPQFLLKKKSCTVFFNLSTIIQNREIKAIFVAFWENFFKIIEYFQSWAALLFY